MAVICNNDQRHRHMSCGKNSRYFYSRHSHNPGMRHRSEFPKLRVIEQDEKIPELWEHNTGVIAKRYVRTISVNHPSSHFTLAKGEFNFEMRSVASLYKQILFHLYTHKWIFMLHVHIRRHRLYILYYINLFFFSGNKKLKISELSYFIVKS